MNESETTRRGVLKRGLALAAGAFGAGAVADTSDAALPPVTMRLTARHVESRGGQGQRHAVLIDARGRTVGHLAGTRMPLQAPFDALDPVLAIELHSLALDGGTLLAQGALRGLGGTFHLVGGDGRFAGARGSYDFRLGQADAELTLTIVSVEVS